MEVNGQHHAPTALPSSKSAPLGIDYCAVRTLGPVQTVIEEKNVCSYWESGEKY